MLLKRIVAAGLAVGAILTAIPAHAGDCAAREQVVQRLERDYAEKLTGGGLHDAEALDTVVEVWASPETGTFTVILTGADGVSCILATGTDWFQMRDAMPEQAGIES
ncbi:hypothetical protein [Aquicoccus sp.]|uniref:hypothetical protein n=1 Tax=Aquicoccus sp. TaxID=2055851 RepID=UPI0035645AF8